MKTREREGSTAPVKQTNVQGKKTNKQTLGQSEIFDVDQKQFPTKISELHDLGSLTLGEIEEVVGPVEHK